jgi:hypothetical protein
VSSFELTFFYTTREGKEREKKMRANCFAIAMQLARKLNMAYVPLCRE